MSSETSPVTSRASGRLCLLGEHADYLGLEVISFPLDACLTVTGRPVAGPSWTIDLLDLGTRRSVEPAKPVPIEEPNDYLAQAFNRVLARGGRFETAYHVRIQSQIPIGKGVSSSSAFCVAWSDFLDRVATPPRVLAPAERAEEAYALEVLDFDQSGGMQDHFTIAYGRLVHLDCQGPVRVTELPASLRGFVLGDSGTRKDTQGVLSRIRGTVERTLQKLDWPRERLRDAGVEDVQAVAAQLNGLEHDILVATVLNREQVRAGAQLLRGSLEDRHAQRELGRLLSEHHHHLQSRLRTSTAAIDRGLSVALRAGALGGKVLGSGAGGCFLVYAPHETDAVLAALADAGFHARAVVF